MIIYIIDQLYVLYVDDIKRFNVFYVFKQLPQAISCLRTILR